MEFKEKKRPLGTRLQVEIIAKRLEESAKVRAEHPDRIPVICERYKSSTMPALDKSK